MEIFPSRGLTLLLCGVRLLVSSVSWMSRGKALWCDVLWTCRARASIANRASLAATESAQRASAYSSAASSAAARAAANAER